MQSNNLSGPLPPELGNLANLQVLYLQDNQLSGPIPPALGNLANLQRLNLSGNNLSGELPEALANVAAGPETVEPEAEAEPETSEQETETVVIGEGFCGSVEGLAEQDCEALLAVYQSANGDDWTNKDGWLNTNTPCEWFGVQCRLDRVELLRLSENNLTGTLPPELGNLPGTEIALLVPEPD